MNEIKIKTDEVLNGGVIETWKINGLYYVKSIVSGVVKYSIAVPINECDDFVFEAKFYGNLEF